VRGRFNEIIVVGSTASAMTNSN